MSDFVLIVYQDDDATPLFEVGTATAHPNPYLQVPTQFGEAEIDLREGRAMIGQINVQVIDPQTGASQAERWLTALLGNASGYSALNGRRALFQQVTPSVVVVLDGVIGGVTLNESFAGFTLPVRDIRERGRKIKLFSRSGTSTVLPRGVLDGYGLNPGGEWLVPPSAGLQAEYREGGTSTSSFWFTPVVAGGEIPAELVVTPALEKVGWSGIVEEAGVKRATYPDVEIVWRAVGASAWNRMGAIDVPWAGLLGGAEPVNGGDFWLFGYTHGTAKLLDGEERSVRGVNQIWAGDPSDGRLRPAAGTTVEVAVVYTGAPTEDFPFHFEGTAGELLRNAYRGDYGSPREDGTLPDPRLRYDEALLVGGAAIPAMNTPVRLRITEPEEDLRRWTEKIYQAVRSAPALDASGQIAPIDSRLPGADTTLPQVDDTNAQPIAGWDHPLSTAVTLVRVEYQRDFRVPAEQDPTGEIAAGDGITSRDVEVIHRAPAPVMDIVGEKSLEIDGFMFRALGGTKGEPMSGDVADEAGAQAAREAANATLDRFAYGGQSSFMKVSRQDAALAALKVGDWILDGRSWRPDYAAGTRGGNALAQVVAIRDLNPAWREIRTVDAAPADNPLPQPTIAAPTADAEGVVSVEVTAIPAGSLVRVDYAVAAVMPTSNAASWTYMGRTAVLETLRSSALPSGSTVWVRARSEATGRRSSAWTLPASVATPETPRVRRVVVEIDPDSGVPSVKWTPGRWMGGARISYGLHLAEVAPVLGGAVDVDGTTGEHVLSAVTVRPGETITVQVEPWRTFDGTTVGGDSGSPVRASTTRGGTEEQSPLSLIGFDVLNRTDEHAEAVWENGARIRYVWIFLRRVKQPVADGYDPAPGADEVPDVILSAGEESYFLDVPPPRYLLYAYFVPLDAELNRGPMERATINPTNEPPDILTSLSVLVDDEDGSVWVRAEAVDRTESYRYAYVVGAEPAWPSDAAVKAGAVRTINGSDAFELPAGTVPYNQTIRLRAAPYLFSGGTGTDGAGDHGEIKAAEDLRLKPPVSLEVTTEDESSGTTGTFGVTVRDEGGYATDLYVRTKAGEAPWTAWALETASPANGTEYQSDVALIEAHPSHVEYRLDYQFNGATGSVHQKSSGFDRGAIPNITIVPKIDEGTGAASASVIGDSDTVSVKIAASTAGTPSEATVRAAAAISGRMLTPAQIGTLLTAELGQTVYYAAFGYGPNGEESSALAKAEALFQPIAPTMTVATEEEALATGVYAITLQDKAGQADALYYRTKSGAGAWSAWTLKSGAPADATTYTETVALVESHLSFIEFRLDYTLGGELFSVHQGSAGFDKGMIPDPSLVPNVDELGNVSAAIQGDFDMASAKVLAWEKSAYPGDAAALTAVRAAPALEGRMLTRAQIGTLVTLAVGQSAVVACLGYSAAAGGGNESSALMTAEIGYQVGAIVPKVQAQLSRSGSTATLTLTIEDPELRTTAIEFKKREGGGGASGWLSSWDGSTGTPGASTSLTRWEAVSVPAGLDSEISWRVLYTDQDSVVRTIGDTIPVPNLGSVAKKIRISCHAFRPQNETIDFLQLTNELTLNSGAGIFYATVPLPPGITITGATAALRQGTAADDAIARLHYTVGTGAATTLATMDPGATTGIVVTSVPASHTVGSNHVLFFSVEMVKDAAGTVGCFYFDVSYTASDYSKTY